MGDPSCEQSASIAVEPDGILRVDIGSASSFCKARSKGKNKEVMAISAGEALRQEGSIESSAGTEALTDASFGEEECLLKSNLPRAVNRKPAEGGSDAGSSIPSDSLHSFFSLLFDENTSKLDDLNDSDEWNNDKKEENQQSEKLESNPTEQPLKEMEFETSLDQMENVPVPSESSQLPSNSHVENPQSEKKKSEAETGLHQMQNVHDKDSQPPLESHAEIPQRERKQSEARGRGRALLRRGYSDSRLISGVSNAKKKFDKEVEEKQPDTNRTEQERVVPTLSKSQSSLELWDVFDSSLTSVEQTETQPSSREEKVQQDSRQRANSQDKGTKMSSIQEKKASNKWHSSAADINRKWNSFHGGFSQPSKQNKASTVRPSLEIKPDSSHGQSFRSKFGRQSSISSFFSNDKRRLSPSKSFQTNEVNTAARLDKIREKEVSTGNDLDSVIAFGMDDTDRISNLIDKKESARGEAVAHRRDELIDSIRQSLHNEDGLQNLRGPLPKVSRRPDKSKEDLLASSTHSQASYFSKMKAPKRVFSAADSIRKLAYRAKETAKVGASKAKETAKAGAMLATKATVTTARATVMAPAYAASYVVNLKGRSQSSDPPADESNVEPIPTRPAQHIEQNSERHRVSESRMEDMRARKSTPHRQRSGSGDSENRKRSSSRHRGSTEKGSRTNPSRQNSDTDRPRHRSKSISSSRHRSHEDKTSIRSRSVRRDREESLDSHHSDRDRNGDKKSTGTNDSRSQSTRLRRDSDTHIVPSRKRESSRTRSGEEQGATSRRPTQTGSRSSRGGEEKSVASRSHSRGRSDDRSSAVSQHRSRSRRRVDDAGTVASSRPRTSRSISRKRSGDLDESTHRTRRRGRSLRRSDPPGLAVDYEKEEKQAEADSQVREYRGRSKSSGPRRKRRTSITK